MAQPPAYVPSSFSDEELDEAILEQLDTEHSNIQAFADAVRTNLALIQRDDGKLANASVHKQAFSAEALSLFLASWNPRGAWVTATEYVARDVVTEGGDTWLCVEDHTSGTFATDQSAGKWMAITSPGEGTILDQDDFNSNSAVDAPSQQSTKVYTVNKGDFTAKGQIIVGTASGAYTALAVGSQGKIPRADPNAGSGISWVVPGLRRVEHSTAAQLEQNTENIYNLFGGDAAFNLPQLSNTSVGDEVIMRAYNGFARFRVATHSVDGADILWVGCEDSDFARFQKSPGGTWRVMEHYETVYARLSKNGDQTVAQGVSNQVTGFTVDADPASLFGTAELVIPANMFAFMDLSWGITQAPARSLTPEVKINGAYHADLSGLVGATPGYAPNPVVLFSVGLTPGDDIEFWARNLDNDSGSADVRGTMSKVYAKFRWRY